jgi:hypothetical protein
MYKKILKNKKGLFLTVFWFDFSLNISGHSKIQMYLITRSNESLPKAVINLPS